MTYTLGHRSVDFGVLCFRKVNGGQPLVNMIFDKRIEKVKYRTAEQKEQVSGHRVRHTFGPNLFNVNQLDQTLTWKSSNFFEAKLGQERSTDFTKSQPLVNPDILSEVPPSHMNNDNEPGASGLRFPSKVEETVIVALAVVGGTVMISAVVGIGKHRQMNYQEGILCYIIAPCTF